MFKLPLIKLSMIARIRRKVYIEAAGLFYNCIHLYNYTLPFCFTFMYTV